MPSRRDPPIRATMSLVARRGFRAHLGRLSASMLGVAVAIAFVCCTNVVTSTLGRSFDELFTDVYGRIDVVVQGRFGGNGSVDAAFGGAHSVVDADLVQTVQQVTGVDVAVGQVQQPIALVSPDGHVLNPNGVPPTFGLNWPDHPALNRWNVSSGRPPSADDEALVDRRTAADLAVGPGDSIRVVAADGSTRPLRVSGVGGFGGGDSYAGSAAVVMATPAAQRVFLEEDTFNWVSATAKPGVTQAELHRAIRSELPREAKAYTGAEFTKQAQKTFGGYVELLSRFLLAFAYVAVAVGAYSIFNTFSILIAQRQRELALLRALGAGRWQVLRSVLLEAGLTGTTAAVLGVGLGVAAAALLRVVLIRFGVLLPGIGLQISPRMIVTVVALGAGCTLVAAALPAWRASRVRPIAAMREAAVIDVPAARRRMLAGVLMLAYSAWSIRRGLGGQPDTVGVVAGGLASGFIGFAVLSPLFWARASRLAIAPLARLGGFVGLLAGRNTARQPLRTARVGAALVTGVGLVTMFAVMTASLAGASAEEVRRGTRSDLIVHPDLARGGTVSPDVQERVRSLPGVELAAGARFTYTEVAELSGLAIGIEPSLIPSVFDVEVTDGSLDRLGGARIAVERDVASEHHWSVGSRLTGEFVQAGYEELEIAAIVEGRLPFGGVSIFMPPADFDRRVPPAQRGDGLLYVRVEPGFATEAVHAEVRRIISDHPLLRADTLEQFAGAQVAAAETFVNVVSGLLLIALLVAFIGVGNTLLLSVLERVGEIGLLRAVGMQRRQVRRMVQWEGLELGLCGATMGLALGLVAGWVLTRAAGGDLPVLVPWARLVATAGLAAMLAVAASVPPARRAARMPILAAISS